MKSRTVESLQQELSSAGCNPDAVQRVPDPSRVPQDGVYLVRSNDSGVEVTHFERGQEGSIESFTSEADAIFELHRRLLEQPPARKLTPEEWVQGAARMQAKAKATLERLAHRRTGDEE